VGALITITVDLADIVPGSRSQLEAELSALGLGKTLSVTEGGDMDVPPGTYAAEIDEGDPMEQLRHYYRSFIDIMRKLDLHGAYMVNLCQKPCYTCGKL